MLDLLGRAPGSLLFRDQIQEKSTLAVAVPYSPRAQIFPLICLGKIRSSFQRCLSNVHSLSGLQRPARILFCQYSSMPFESVQKLILLVLKIVQISTRMLLSA